MEKFTITYFNKKNNLISKQLNLGLKISSIFTIFLFKKLFTFKRVNQKNNISKVCLYFKKVF